MYSRYKDYYRILGVPDSSSQEEIRRAFRSLALKWHPDMHVGESPESIAYAEGIFKEIVQAYETLSDPKKRSDYDYHRGYQISRPEPRTTYQSSTKEETTRQSGSYSYSRYYGPEYGYYYQRTDSACHNIKKDRSAQKKGWFARNTRTIIISVLYSLWLICSKPIDDIKNQIWLHKQNEYVSQPIVFTFHKLYGIEAYKDSIRSPFHLSDNVIFNKYADFQTGVGH